MIKSKWNLFSEISLVGFFIVLFLFKYFLILGKCWCLIRMLNFWVGSIMVGFKCNWFVWEMIIKNL